MRERERVREKGSSQALALINVKCEGEEKKKMRRTQKTRLVSSRRSQGTNKNLQLVHDKQLFFKSI